MQIKEDNSESLCTDASFQTEDEARRGMLDREPSVPRFQRESTGIETSADVVDWYLS